jgi:hypothetical protein
LINLIKNNHIIELDNRLPLENAINYQITIEFPKISNNPENINAINIQDMINVIINNIVDKMLPCIKIEYNEDSVNMLLARLESGSYKSRNYSFFEIRHFNEDIRKSNNYINRRYKSL